MRVVYHDYHHYGNMEDLSALKLLKSFVIRLLEIPWGELIFRGHILHNCSWGPYAPATPVVELSHP